ncbi:MAG: FtsX-like permease family protein [Hyphomicrobiaceae bacterium]
MGARLCARKCMIALLALRNLIHDRVSLAVTLTGIIFSVILVAIQLGLYIGSHRIITGIIDHSGGQIWVVPPGAESVDDTSELPGGERHVVLSTPGVKSAVEMVTGFAEWQRPDGSTTATVLVGGNIEDGSIRPWNMIAGRPEALSAPNAVIIDRSYFKDLGVEGVGSHGQIGEMKTTVVGVTKGIRSFTTLPYIFTTLDRGRTYLGLAKDQSTFILADVLPGTDVVAVRDAIRARLHGVEVLTRQEFLDRSIHHWLFNTGAGAALIAGAVLGIIVGMVIVAQTLYASTKDHLNEFATLRALGAGAHYIHKVILCQALISAVIGYAVGMGIALFIVRSADGSALPLTMTKELAAALFALTVVMCAISAMAAIVKVTRIDPAMVFAR